MLTPANIKNHQFQNLGRGFYKTDEVDSYIDEIYSSYNLVYNENKELIRKLNILASKIEEYRNDEQSIRNAIINAQRMASKLIDEARKEAQSIIEAAETKAETADSITNVRIKKRVDEVEAMLKQTFDKARDQAKRATEKAESDAKAVITDAKIKASEIIENAAKTSRLQLATIAEDINSQQSLLSKLKEESESFKNTMIKRYEDQIYLIKSISDFALSEIDDSFAPESEESETTKSKVDEIIESIFNEKLSSHDDFSASFTDDFSDAPFTDTEMTFEDIYSSSGPVENSTNENEDVDHFFNTTDNKYDNTALDGFEDIFSNDDLYFSKDKPTFDDSFSTETSDEIVSGKVDEENDDPQDSIEEFDVDDFDENEFEFEDIESISGSDESDDVSDSSDESDDKTDKPFSISFDDNSSLEDTFEFDFVDDDE